LTGSGKTYLMKFKEPDVVSLHVIAATVETHGEHLVFLRADGRLGALVLAESIEEWFELLASGALDFFKQETYLAILKL
jgi:hypothetical protein